MSGLVLVRAAVYGGREPLREHIQACAHISSRLERRIRQDRCGSFSRVSRSMILEHKGWHLSGRTELDCGAGLS